MAFASQLSELQVDPRETAEVATAQRDAIADVLRDVLKLFDRKQHMTYEQQLVIWRAEAVLAEVKR
jgi:hypothetical protein